MKLMPKFLKLPIYAFDISDLSYKYLRLEESADGIRVADYGEGEIAPGIIEEGEIKKKDVLTALLKELFLKKRIKYAAVALPEEKGFLRYVSLTGIKEEEIYDVLELQLEEHVPLPPSEVVFDYTIVSKEKEHIDIVLRAFPRALIESYAETISSAGGILTLAESEALSTLRAAVPKSFKKTGMLIDFGRTKTTFSIFNNEVLEFVSSAHIGGLNLDDAIAKNLNIDLKKAKELKEEKGFSQMPDSLSVFQAMVPAVTAIREEADKYIAYWQTHSEKKDIPEKIFITGGNASLIGLADYFSKELNIETVAMNPWVNVKLPLRYLPDIEFRNSLRFAVSIGLALRALEESKTL